MLGRQREKCQSFIVHFLEVKQTLDGALDLRVVEPRHFRDLRQQNHHHLCHLLVKSGFLGEKEVDDEVFNTKLLIDCNRRPMFGEKLLEGGCRNELDKL